ncbi:hypothetical protein [Bradyrhizobium sp. CIR3A]|uniref:hypothetical protein n=1 Tax=Bradyrhizobium sp. CIR3A TaxID=2663838 RepID=UPI001605640A|nr:hypothetical protein [Bradyrhizobium sp. CIR3A]MBB4259977.1 hypothetical protein [Bradyrhizobium sp. CIR3A]
MPRQTRSQALGPFLAAASSTKAIRKRVMLIGHERGLDASSLADVLKAKAHTERGLEKLLRFAGDHNLNCDWLFTGDLRGLRQMRPRA